MLAFSISMPRGGSKGRRAAGALPAPRPLNLNGFDLLRSRQELARDLLEFEFARGRYVFALRDPAHGVSEAIDRLPRRKVDDVRRVERLGRRLHFALIQVGLEQARGLFRVDLPLVRESDGLVVAVDGRGIER